MPMTFLIKIPLTFTESCPGPCIRYESFTVDNDDNDTVFRPSKPPGCHGGVTTSVPSLRIPRDPFRRTHPTTRGTESRSNLKGTYVENSRPQSQKKERKKPQIRLQDSDRIGETSRPLLVFLLPLPSVSFILILRPIQTKIIDCFTCNRCENSPIVGLLYTRHKTSRTTGFRECHKLTVEE